ncbi:MAG: hydrogenase expression/formation protein HypE, partial [Planctomycetota bacterium]
MTTGAAWLSNCPVLVDADSVRISLAHGEGARLSRQLLTQTILPQLNAVGPYCFSDAAHVEASGCRLAVCSDSHTVSPLFFPGGNIGSLSIYGTVNDLAVSGARPRWLTLSLILEEGLPLAILDAVLSSVSAAARECEITIISGDTKVVPRGAADSMFINTTGLGELIEPVPQGPVSIQPGDRILVSGPIGNHGMAVMNAREEIFPEARLISDSRSLLRATETLRQTAGGQLRCMRDATRGGVSSVLHEWAYESRHSFLLQESRIPIHEVVRGACELLGLDPLYVANEGTLLAVVAPEVAADSEAALRRLKGHESAAIIGDVIPSTISPVMVQRTFASPRPLDEPGGA